MAFVRFTVVDNNNNHIISQRVISLKCLRQGYRHLRLRNPQNQTLELSSLFFYSRQRIEHTQTTTSNLNIYGISSSNNEAESSSIANNSKSQAKHKQFKLIVYGLNGDSDENDNGTQVKVTQETTVQQLIEQVIFYF